MTSPLLEAALKIDNGTSRNVIHQADNFVIYQMVIKNKISYEYWIGRSLFSIKDTLADLVATLDDYDAFHWADEIRKRNNTSL